MTTRSLFLSFGFSFITLAIGLIASPRAQANLVAHWSFDETSGTALADSTGNHDGTGQNGLAGSVNAGVVGNAWSFAGGANNSSSEYVAVTPGSITGLTDMTMMMWFKTTTDLGMMFSASNTSVGSAEFGIRITDGAGAGGVMYIARTDPGGPDILATSPTPYNDDQWHHAAASLSAGGYELYVDGQLVASGTDVNNPAAIGANDVSIGRNKDSTAGGGQWFYSGLLDDMAIFDTALSGQEIMQIYQNGLSGQPVPEPASMVLMGLGVALVSRRRRRRA